MHHFKGNSALFFGHISREGFLPLKELFISALYLNYLMNLLFSSADPAHRQTAICIYVYFNMFFTNLLFFHINGHEELHSQRNMKIHRRDALPCVSTGDFHINGHD
jgi:hypothetical protein